MVLKGLQDKELNLNLLKMVQNERKLTSQILDYLNEVEIRKLFAKRGYLSLFSYCTEFLGYSESAAQRRISSMRLLREVPQIKSHITSGELSHSNVSKAASFFRQEQRVHQKIYSPKEKSKVLQSLQGKTQKEAERELVNINPRVFKNIDRVRAIAPEITEVKVTLDQEVMEKLSRLKELKPGLDTQELLDWMLSRCLKQIDPLIKPKRKPKPESRNTLKHDARKAMKLESEKASKYGSRETLKSKGKILLNSEAEKILNPLGKKALPQRTQPLRRSLCRITKHQVWQKARACCEFTDHQSGRVCQSHVGLEIDHIQPLSLGGNDDPENLRLLCRVHHKLLTHRSFGGGSRGVTFTSGN